MAGILIDSFDTKLFDSIVADEITENYERAGRAFNYILDAFHAIADENVNIEDGDEYFVLEDLAISASEDWADYFNSLTDRRAILFRMFQKATPIIKAIPPAKHDFIYSTGNEEISQSDLDRLRESLKDFYNRNYGNFAVNKQKFQKYFNKNP